MRKVNTTTRKPKVHYYILYRGRMVGETWAVSPEKARTNYWWKNVKGGDPFAYRDRNPQDYDVVEANK